MKKLTAFLRGEAFGELVRYGVIGVLTTLVNLFVYWLCMLPFGNAPGNWAITFAQVVAWAASVAFAFVANRRFVFRSQSGAVLGELASFTLARLLSLAFDIVFVLALVNLARMNDMTAKVISNVLVIVINYFVSKLWVFRDK